MEYLIGFIFYATVHYLITNSIVKKEFGKFGKELNKKL